MHLLGRVEEKERLVAQLHRLRDGKGSLIVLSGIRGVGKTALARWLTEQAETVLARSVWVRHGPIGPAPSVWPLNDALSALSDAKVFPVAPREPEDGVSPRRDSEQFARFHVLQEHIRALCADRAHIIVLDDAQHADAGTLRFLEFLAPQLTDLAVMILVCVQTPLVQKRGDGQYQGFSVVQLQGADRIRLNGLARPDVDTLIANRCGASPPATFSERLAHLTAGCPFFLHELLTALADAGHLARASEGQWPDDILLPDSLVAIANRAIRQTSNDGADLLEIASVLGYRFPSAVLEALATIVGHERTIVTIDAVEADGLIVAETVGATDFRFAHPLIREVAYDTMPFSRRRRLHGEAFEATLKCVGRSADLDALSTLASHVQRSGRATGPDIIAELVRESAREAAQFRDHRTEAELYQIAVSAFSNQSAKPKVDAVDIALAQSRAFRKAGELDRAIEAANQAWAWAERLADYERMAGAAIEVETTRVLVAKPSAMSIAKLKTALELIPRTVSGLRARLLGCLACALAYTFDQGEGVDLAFEAVEMAKRSGDADTISETLVFAIHAIRNRISLHPQMHQWSRQLVDIARTDADAEWMARALQTHCLALVELGKGDEYLNALAEFETYALLTNQPFFTSQIPLHRFAEAMLSGRFSAAPALAVAGREEGEKVVGFDRDGVFGIQIFALNRELGRLKFVAPLLEQVSANSTVWRPGLALIKAEIGDVSGAETLLEELASNGFALVPRDDLWPISIAFLADVRLLAPSHRFADDLIRELLPFRPYTVFLGPNAVNLGPASRLLGGLYGLVGDYETARACFEEAFAMATDMKSPPMQLRCRTDYIEALLREGTPTSIRRADDLLNDLEDSVIQLGMMALAERVNALQKQRRALSKRHGIHTLTPRELEVLRLMSRGFSNAAIADRLTVAPSTVATHVKRILSKTDSRNRTAASNFARRNGILT